MTQNVITTEELENFQFPLIGIASELTEVGIARKKLPLDLFLKHEGYKCKIRRKQFVLTISNYENHPKDSLKLEISTYIGISPDAVHYYGSLSLPRIHFTDRKGVTYGGYGIPTILWDISLRRSLTTFELENFPDRYRNYKSGSLIQGFDNQAQIITHAQEVAERHFPGFKLIVPKFEE